MDRKLVFENGKQFLGHPEDDNLDHIADTRIWDVFQRPEIQTIAETHTDEFQQNLSVLTAIEEMGGFTYLSGQRDYIARMGIKDYGYAVGETGVGKTLIAISMITLKGADRTLIVAPQGTIRGDEHTTSQWLSELRRFAPFLRVFELFRKEDYERIIRQNGGGLPAGVYLTYYEAMFQNEAVENIPTDCYGFPKWSDAVLFAKAKVPGSGSGGGYEFIAGVGERVSGIRCVARPSLATLIGDSFDMICLDEAQYCKNSSSNRTRAFVQLEARYRFAFSATPIPNTVRDLFPVMGWLCVPKWWRGGCANAAWPYRLEDESRFAAQFTSMERDYTREQLNRRANARWRGRCERSSPVIASPVRLLRLLQPTMAFIAKQDCSPVYVPPIIRDIRVKMGKGQRRLYGYFMDPGNIRRLDGRRYRDQRIAAGIQANRLRAVCTDPANVDAEHGGPVVRSSFNPKLIAVLELVQSTLAKGQQVVIVNSRIGITHEVARRLEECGVPYSRIDSTKSEKAREAAQFKAGAARVMLMGINCASGYSFDQCSTLVISSIEYTPGSFTQAIGRVDRVTSRGSQIYCVLCDHTIESMMFDTVAMKDDAARICLHGERIPRSFIPVDMEEVLADAITSWSDVGESPFEDECEEQWPRLRDAIRRSVIHRRSEYENKAQEE
ncbi:MAG: SNF2-related protein [Opitutaceae bacterium]